MTHIYDKELNYIISLNYNIENFIKDPKLYYPDWKIEYYACATKFENPILDEKQIREMTREEQIIILNKVDLLQDGEVLEKGKIKKVECPAGIIRGAWDKDLKQWKETMTKEELMENRKNKILEYAELKKEIQTLEEFASEFESDNTVEMLKEKMQELKKEINELYKKIKSL